MTKCLPAVMSQVTGLSRVPSTRSPQLSPGGPSLGAVRAKATNVPPKPLVAPNDLSPFMPQRPVVLPPVNPVVDWPHFSLCEDCWSRQKACCQSHSQKTLVRLPDHPFLLGLAKFLLLSCKPAEGKKVAEGMRDQRSAPVGPVEDSLVMAGFLLGVA